MERPVFERILFPPEGDERSVDDLPLKELPVVQRRERPLVVRRDLDKNVIPSNHPSIGEAKPGVKR